MITKYKYFFIILTLLCLLFAIQELSAKEEIDYKTKYEALLEKNKTVTQDYYHLYMNYIALRKSVVRQELITAYDKKKGKEYHFVCYQVKGI